MASCHLVADTDLALLGDIDFCHLDDARGEFVANGERKLLAVKFGCKNLVLLEVVDDELADEFIRVFIICPSCELYSCIVNVVKSTCNEFGAAWDVTPKINKATNEIMSPFDKFPEFD